MELYNYKALITRVVDGDTIDAVIDTGFSIKITHRLRLLGINAPERTSSDLEVRTRATASKTYLEGLVLNKEVQIHTEKDDAFGRYLAQVYLPGDINVNQLMVLNGHAVIY